MRWRALYGGHSGEGRRGLSSPYLLYRTAGTLSLFAVLTRGDLIRSRDPLRSAEEVRRSTAEALQQLASPEAQAETEAFGLLGGS